MTEKKFTGRRWDLDLVRSRCEVVDQCWIWTQGVNFNGYPQACIEGRCGLVARWVLGQVLAERRRAPLTNKHCAKPKCGNPLCVSPHCLRKVTRSQVLEESYKSGRRKDREAARDRSISNGWAKLDRQKAEQIRNLHGLRPAVEVAVEFGVHQATIRRIWQGVKWRPEQAANSVWNWRPAA